MALALYTYLCFSSVMNVINFISRLTNLNEAYEDSKAKKKKIQTHVIYELNIRN